MFTSAKHSHRRRGALLLTGLTLAAGGAMAPAAHAGLTGTYDVYHVMTITGSPSADTYTIGCDADGLVVINGTHPFSAHCGGANGVAMFIFKLGDGDDTINFSQMTAGHWSDFDALQQGLYVDGGEGDDTIKAPAALGIGAMANADTLRGGPGNDTIVGAKGDDSIYPGGGKDFVAGGDGHDQLYAKAAGASYAASKLYLGDDTVSVGAVEELDLIGTADNETFALASYPGFARIDAGLGNDFIVGTSGDDELYGGEGDDAINGGDGDDQIAGYFGNDVLHGGDGADSITSGHSKPDASAKDVLTGDAGDDLLQVYEASGASTADGGADHDVIWADADEPLKLDGGAGSDDLRTSGSGTLTDTTYGAAKVAGFEGLVVNGAVDFDASAFSGKTDMTVADGKPSHLLGGKGANHLQGSDAVDVLVGGPAGDSIDGGAGDDTVTGNGGADSLQGGAGKDDTLREMAVAGVSFGAATMTRGNGVQSAQAGFETAVVTGTGADDVLDGGAFPGRVKFHGAGGNDTLTGTPRADVLEAGIGIDTLKGLAGDDTMLGRNSTLTTFDCGEGADKGERDAGDVVSGCEDVAAPAVDPQVPVVADTSTDAKGSGGETVVPSGGTGGTGTKPGPGATTASFTLDAARLRVRRGRVTVQVRCAAGAQCTGKLELRLAKGRRSVVAASPFSVKASSTGRVTLRLKRSAVTAVRRAGRRGLAVKTTAAAGGKTVAARGRLVR